jgi:ribosome maturation factor RimP
MSAREEVIARVRAAAVRIAASYGLDIFDVQFRREAVGWVLRVMIDRVPIAGAGVEDAARVAPHGQEELVGIDDCRHVSDDLSARLDVDESLGDALGQNYTLEVSSPGLDRPLRGEADFRRFRGRLAKLVTREAIERQTSFAGRIDGVEDGVVLLNEGRRVHRVPLSLISRARLEVEF